MFSSFMLSFITKKNHNYEYKKIHKIVRNFYSMGSDVETEKNQSKLMSDLKLILKREKISFKDGYTSYQFDKCLICPQQQHQQANKIFINKKTGKFLCPTCEVNIPLKNFLECLENKNFDKSKYETKISDYESNRMPISSISDEIIKKLSFPLVDIKVLENLSVKYDSQESKLYVPLKNLEGRIVGEKTYNLISNNEESVLPVTNSSGLISYSWTTKGNIKKAILVLNLKDFFTLIMEKLQDSTIICLPYGLTYLPQECLPLLEKYTKITFWFNFDVAGWDAAKNFAKKLNEKRCYFVRPTINHKTPYGASKRKLNLQHILDAAKPLYHESITTFHSLKEDILSEIQNIEKVNGVKWKRFPVLNKLLKGHRKGELTILTGPTGSGKTTFMSEYSLDLAMQGVSTLWGSFEIRNIRLASTLLRQFAGFPLNERINEFEYWAEKFEKLPVYFMTFHGQQALKKVMEAVEYAQYVHDIQHVIIDNVQFMMGLSMGIKNDKFFEQDCIISNFREFATTKNVHVTLVMHPRKERDSEDLSTSSIFGSAKASQEADNVLIIQDQRLTSVRGKKFLQVTKNRYSGDLGIMPLTFDKDSLSYGRLKKDQI